MNHTVAGADIRQSDGGAVHHDGISDSERKRLTVDSVCSHTLRDIGCWDITCYNVIEQNVGKCCLTFWRIQSAQINACIGERLVRWCKHGERAWTLERLEQVRLNDGGNQ